MTDTFVAHTAETAPDGARATVESTEKAFGFVPGPVARMATSPELLNAFMAANGLFERTSFSPLEREVLIMTVSTTFGCHYCVAMHSALLTKQGAPGELLASLRDGKPVADPRLQALRSFTLAVIETRGSAGDEALDAFFAAGFTPQNALEVVLGVGTYTLTTFANRLTRVDVDAVFAAFSWAPSH